MTCNFIGDRCLACRAHIDDTRTVTWQPDTRRFTCDGDTDSDERETV